MKVYTEQGQEDRRAKQERHDLANKLQTAYIELDSLKSAFLKNTTDIKQSQSDIKQSQTDKVA